jgi:hypothetical protein
VLLGEWPADDLVDAELRQLVAARSQVPVYVFSVGAAASKEAARMLPHLDFLPDAMVLEAEWQQERGWARQIETWRSQLGEKLSSEVFLQTARRAIYLRKWIALGGVRHLHAMTTGELLCAWMLHRISGVTFSCTVEAKQQQLPNAVVCRLLDGCAGLRLAGQIAPEFSEAALPHPPPQIFRYKPGGKLEPELLAQLGAWGAHENPG